MGLPGWFRMCLGPGHEGPARKFWPLVGSHSLRVAPEPRNLFEHEHDVLAADAMVHSDVHALVTEVVGHGQTLDAPPSGQAVADEVHAPDFIDGPALVQRHAFELQVLLAAPLTHRRQVGQPVEPVPALAHRASSRLRRLSIALVRVAGCRPRGARLLKIDSWN